MRLLLDTHALIWWTADCPLLSPAARQAIEDVENDVMVSAASAWEIATKYRLGRLPAAEALAVNITGAIIGQGFDPLPLTMEDGERAGSLSGPVQDPFDRMLIAQALSRNLLLVSIEAPFDHYGVRRLW